MRAALVLAAALPLTLGACKVDVEGAPCTAAGETGDCPSAQACGVDLKCSTRAAECLEPSLRCVSGAKACSPDGARIETCTASDPCGAWAFLPGDVDCSAERLACGGSGSTPTCVCPASGPEIVVDLGAPAGTVAATGASQPPECRFRTLTDALSYARAWRSSHSGARATVRATGAPTPASPAVFGGEAFPLRIPSGVTLDTDSSPPAPDAWIVSADPQGASNVAEIESDAAIEGFTVRSISAAGDGIVVVCDTGATHAVARSVRVDGRGMLRHGVSVQGACGLEASDLVARGAVESGVVVDATLADPAVADVGVELSGGELADNGGAGAELRAGFLEVAGTSSAPVAISGNQGFGVAALARDTSDGRPYAAIELDVAFADVSANGEAGVLISGTSLPAGRAAILNTRIHGNLGQTSASEHTAGRRGAGILLRGTPVAMEFAGNQVFANGSTIPNVVQDQIAVFSTAKWTFTGTDCAAGANAFACPAPGGVLVYSSAVSAAGYAQAGNAYWPLETWPPDALVFHTTYMPICLAEASRLPACGP
jgi:hypothetical protein